MLHPILEEDTNALDLDRASISRRSPNANALDIDANLDMGRQMLHFINKERVAGRLVPLNVAPRLEQLALQQARAMTDSRQVYHSASSIQALQRLCAASEHVGENVLRGDGIEQMHRDTMDGVNTTSRTNVLTACFSEFGCAVAVEPESGKLYCCQLFRS
jgi:uncharacterized protein YkwD